MNAIQYFEWGGEGKKIVPITLVIENAFSKAPILNGKIPIDKPYKASISGVLLNQMGYDGSTYAESSVIQKNGNDLILKLFFKNNIIVKNIEYEQIRLSIDIDNDYNYFSNIHTIMNGTFYVNEKKIKYDGYYDRNRLIIFNSSLNVIFNSSKSASRNERVLLQYEDGEKITIKKLFNKQITMKIS